MVPIPKDIYFKNKKNLVRLVIDEITTKTSVTPITTDHYCPFLSKNYQCTIYEHRPKTCQEFGHHPHMLMRCPHMKPDGRLRSPIEKEAFVKTMNHYAECIENNLI